MSKKKMHDSMDAQMNETPALHYKRRVTTKNGKSERILQESVCPVLETCGKCTLLNMPYKDQLFHKSQQIKETFHLMGADFAHVSVKDCVGSHEKLGYRRSVHLMISEHKSLPDNRGIAKRRIDIGFYQSLNMLRTKAASSFPMSIRVVDIGRCPIQTIHLNHIIAWLRTGIRLHNVSIQTPLKKEGLLESVILHSTQNSKQIFVCFVVTKLNSTQLRSLACDISAKFSNVAGIFMKTKDDIENQRVKILTGRSEIEENFLGTKIPQTLKSIFHPNLPMIEKIVSRIEDIKASYSQNDSFQIISTNPFVSSVVECEEWEEVVKQKPKMICFVSSLSQSAQKMLRIFNEHNYVPLFVEPFDVLPGTDYCENIILLSKD